MRLVLRLYSGRILALLLPFLLLSGCAAERPRDLTAAPEGVQGIHFYHKGSGERIQVAFRLGGRYSEEAFRQIDRIFRDRQNDRIYAVDPDLIELIAGLRDRMAMPPETEIELLSGYRSPESNAMLARTNRHVAKDSYHTKGQAADIRIPGMVSSVLEMVAKTQQRGGVALYPDSGHVHVDTGPVRGWSVERGFERGVKSGEASRRGRKPANKAFVKGKGKTPPASAASKPASRPAASKTATAKTTTLEAVPKSTAPKKATPKTVVKKAPAKKPVKGKPGAVPVSVPPESQPGGQGAANKVQGMMGSSGFFIMPHLPFLS